MPATEIIPQNLAPEGLEVTFESANVDGNYFVNNGRMVLRVRNASASVRTVTCSAPGKCDQGFNHPVAVLVEANEERDLGLFSSSRFNDENGRVNITYSSVTGVTVAVIKTI